MELCDQGMRLDVVMIQGGSEKKRPTEIYSQSKYTGRSTERHWYQWFQICLETVRRGTEMCLERSIEPKCNKCEGRGFICS